MAYKLKVPLVYNLRISIKLWVFRKSYQIFRHSTRYGPILSILLKFCDIPLLLLILPICWNIADFQYNKLSADCNISYVFKDLKPCCIVFCVLIFDLRGFSQPRMSWLFTWSNNQLAVQFFRLVLVVSSCIIVLWPKVIFYSIGFSSCYGLIKILFPISFIQFFVPLMINSSMKSNLTSFPTVYEGVKSFYKEDDETVPVNMYGKSKVAAEKFIYEKYSNFAILRSSIIYGPQTISPVAKSLPIQVRKLKTLNSL